MLKLHGCYVALVTPFRDGEIDQPALERLIDHVIDGGVDGLVPCGTTGESPTLSADEQARVIAITAKRARKRIPVIAGAGSNCTEKTLAHAKAALAAGADALMLVAPYYNRPSQQGLYEHFGEVAAAHPAVPIMLYNIPGRTGVEISVETIARLHADHPNVVAVKHATGSVDGASNLAAISPIDIFSGDDPLTIPLMSIGAVGVVSVLANLLPREMKALTAAGLAGDWQAARQWHRRLFPIARDLLKLDVNPVPIKTALALRGMMLEEFRLPLCRMAPEARARLQELVTGLAAGAARKEPWKPQPVS